jgi:hypothetical protein
VCVCLNIRQQAEWIGTDMMSVVFTSGTCMLFLVVLTYLVLLAVCVCLNANAGSREHNKKSKKFVFSRF